MTHPAEGTPLLPCPFCGGPADFEECPQGSSVAAMSCTWSVGCVNENEDCIGYQMLAHYNRKSEAAEAWNKRAPLSQGGKAEPAAWRVAGKVSVMTWRKEVAEQWVADGHQVQPLYTAPTPSPSGKAEPVAWRYKCEHDGKYVFMETRLTDEQKARGYFLDDIELEENPEEEGPFKWSEEAPLYASPPPSPASVEAHSPAENVSWTAEMQRAAEKAAFYSPRNFEGIYRAICAALPREEQA